MRVPRASSGGQAVPALPLRHTSTQYRFRFDTPTSQLKVGLADKSVCAGCGDGGGAAVGAELAEDVDEVGFDCGF